MVEGVFLSGPTYQFACGCRRVVDRGKVDGSSGGVFVVEGVAVLANPTAGPSLLRISVSALRERPKRSCARWLGWPGFLSCCDVRSCVHELPCGLAVFVRRRRLGEAKRYAPICINVSLCF
ncbi:hypothetical protein ACQJBY_033043 [Aegilops geniculata]